MIDPNMTSDAYRANPAIGSTTAVLGVDNPMLLRAAIEGRYKVADRPCFIQGRLLHELVLEPAAFHARIKTETSDIPMLTNPKTGEHYGRGTKKFDEWQALCPGVTYVEPWIIDCANAMPPQVRQIFAEGEGEASVFAKICGCPAKCRPDWIIWEGDNAGFWDLKSISTQGQTMERAIDRAIAGRKYWFTTEWYRRVLLEETDRYYPFRLIFAEKEMPHRWRIVDLDFDYECKGKSEVVRVAKAIAAMQLDEDPDDIEYQATAPHYLIEEETDDYAEGSL